LTLEALDKVEEEDKKASRLSSCLGGGCCAPMAYGSRRLLIEGSRAWDGLCDGVAEPIVEVCEVVEIDNNDFLTSISVGARNPLALAFSKGQREVEDVQ
jgi:hypothetical protein